MLGEGTRVGRFALEEAIGSGGVADVYRCVDDGGSPYALKLLRHAESDLDERFVREAELLARLAHPAIVRYVEHGTSEAGRPYLVMEWIAGETLTARLERDAVDCREGVAVIARIAEALGAAHRIGVVHRDVKPDNIVFETDGAEPRLIDFGIARLIAETSGLTATGTTLGTPAYMSPEQARGDRHIDARSDVFSLGCVLYECVTGQRPFRGSNIAAIQTKVLLAEPAPVRELWPEVPAALESLIAAMLAKHADARPADGAAVSARLAKVGAITAAGPASRDAASAPTMTAVIGAAGAPTSAVFIAPTDAALAVEAVEAIAERDDLALRWLADGSAVIAVSAGDAATCVERACRCAVDVRQLAADAAIAVASGRSQAADPLGELLDRGVDLVTDQALKQVFADWAPVPTAIARLDEETAALVSGSLAVTRTDAGVYLSSAS